MAKKTQKQPASIDKIESVEIRDYKEAGGEETIRFEADLYINNIRACVVSNTGTSNDHTYCWLIDRSDIETKLMEHVQKLIQEGFFEHFYQSMEESYKKWGLDLDPIEQSIQLDYYIDILNWESEIKKSCQKKTCFILKSDKWNDIRSISRPYSPQTKEQIVRKYGDKLKEIFNERYVY